MFKSIALGGGGSRGGLLVGALTAIEKQQGHLKFPDGIYGVSIGSVIAVAIASGIDAATLRKLFEDPIMNMDKIMPPVRLRCLTDAPVKKGLFSMNAFEDTIVRLFIKYGIDIRNKKISDLNQPVRILASNMTTRKPTFFSGSVPILDAIKCSCCLPFIFQPQVLYNNVYLDGGVYNHYLHTLVPKDTLVLHISTKPRPIFPTEIATMEISTYMDILYQSARKQVTTSNVLWLENNSVSVTSILTLSDKELLVAQGFEQTSRFIAKRLAEKLE